MRWRVRWRQWARGVGMAGGLGALVAAAAPRVSPERFSAETVRARARELARSPYQAPAPLPRGAFSGLTYDEYRDIRYRPERALWRDAGLPFQAQFFHPGFLFPAPLPLHEVVDGQVVPVRFSPGLFTYGSVVKPPPAAALKGIEGFAGVRLTGPLNRPEHFDEIISFLGASYFRALGRGSVYGASARGLAIDTALPSGEQFPLFREFWLEQPAAGADRAVVHALLDSPSVTGAYRFVILPGERTVVEVEAELHARQAVKQLGVAPLTSMYAFGENDRASAGEDFRPEVHDSDGLALWMRDGERLWRPLQNPSRVSASSFQVKGLRAFGLVQRDRAFTSYEDLEARYDLRPGVWVEPVGDWGAGTVQLVELPTRDEFSDNIVAAWVPETPFVPGAPLRLAWRLHWGSTPPEPSPVGVSTATRITAGRTPGARRFLLEFSSGGPGGEGPVEALVTASAGQVLPPTVQPNPVTGGWRVTFELLPAGGPPPTELRCVLRRGSTPLTETWSYPWTL